MAGYVYLIGTPTFGWYKIGKSATPEVRVKDIGILLPFRIDVFAIWKAQNHHLLEATLHETYSGNRINGEWFGFTKLQVQALISSLPEESRIYPKEGVESVFTSFSNLERDCPEGRKVIVRVVHDGSSDDDKIGHMHGVLRCKLHRLKKRAAALAEGGLLPRFFSK